MSKNKDVRRGISLYIDGKEVEGSVKSIKAEMRKLVREQELMAKGSKEYIEQGKKIRQLKAILAEHNQQLNIINKTQGMSRSKGVDLFNHCPPVQQPHWNTIDLNLFSDLRLLYQMIDEAYEEIVASLTKRKRFQLAEISCFDFIYQEEVNKDFKCLAMLLDETLENIVAGKIERSEYAQYNQLEEIHDIIIVYCNKEPIACGSFRFYDEEHAELKRIYVTPNYQGMGLGYEIIRRLEAIAKIKGFKYCILETGELLQASCHIYKKLGYQRIDNYGPYVNMMNSICMSHKI